jgi:hypothetical protein
MQTPLVSQPVRKAPQNPNLYGGRLSIARFGVSIALVLVTLVIVFAQNGGGGSHAQKSPAPGPFASSMPLP